MLCLRCSWWRWCCYGGGSKAKNWGQWTFHLHTQHQCYPAKIVVSLSLACFQPSWSPKLTPKMSGTKVSLCFFVAVFFIFLNKLWNFLAWRWEMLKSFQDFSIANQRYIWSYIKDMLNKVLSLKRSKLICIEVEVHAKYEHFLISDGKLKFFFLNILGLMRFLMSAGGAFMWRGFSI